MPMLKDKYGKEFSIDGYIKQNLDIAKDVIKKDWDMLFVIDGAEGSGKSVLAQQCAYYCDSNFDIKNIVFTPEEFKQAIYSAQKYTAIVYDEAYTGLSSRATMSMINRALISMLAEIRQKNLFIFVVMPCFFDLDKYVALWRSRALLHVFTGERFQRGRVAFFGSEKKKNLYILGKKYYSYAKPKSNFVAHFTNHYTVDKEEYKKKKAESLVNREEEKAESYKLIATLKAYYAEGFTERHIVSKVKKYGWEVHRESINRFLNCPYIDQGKVILRKI